MSVCPASDRDHRLEIPWPVRLSSRLEIAGSPVRLLQQVELLQTTAQIAFCSLISGIDVLSTVNSIQMITSESRLT